MISFFVSMSIVVSDSVHMVRPPSPPTVSYVTCMPYNNNNNNNNNNNRGLDTAHELILLDASTRALLWFLRSCPNTLCMVRPSVLGSLNVYCLSSLLATLCPLSLTCASARNKRGLACAVDRLI